MTTETAHPLAQLMSVQEEVEMRSLAGGAKRFKERLEKAQEKSAEAGVGGARVMLRHGLALVEQGMKDFLAAAEKGSGGRHYAVKWVKLLGTDVAAYMTLKVVLDTIAKPITARRLSLDLMSLILDELRYRRFKEKAPGLYKYKLTKFTTSNYAHMARSMDAALGHATDADGNPIDISDLEPKTEVRLQVGAALLNILIERTQLVERITEDVGDGRGAKRESLIIATAETQAWLSDANETLALLSPVNLPMVVPPREWSPGRRGGYRFGLAGKHPLVRGIGKAHVQTVAKAQMPTVYAALNRIQGTPWAINTDVLRTLERLKESGGGRGGVPHFTNLMEPGRPLDIDTNEEARKKWRKEAGAVKEENHSRVGKRVSYENILKVAREFSAYPAIWFPHNLDFRGRVYPVVNYLHPQGSDLCKGLLRFAQGKELGPDGAAYLALHGANCMDKLPDGRKAGHMTHQERVDYILSITPQILEVAADPLENDFWMQAEEKVSFLAFCFEWAGFWRAHEAGCGEQYVSSIAVAQDGSCNGLQHYSAMLRDPVGAHATNVSITERPQDIYQHVADAVVKQLEVQASTDEYARLWLSSGLVNRKLCKRPVMTFGYGAKKFGFTGQLHDELKSREDEWADIQAQFGFEPVLDEKTGKPKLDKDGKPRMKSRLPKACSIMAGLIWDGLGDTVVAAQEGMQWLQDCARLVAKNGRCVSWVVPVTGFPIVQEYFKEKSRQIATTLAGRFSPSVYEATTTPDAQKQANSIAPNIVHSLDAAALMMTVEQAAAHGIENFAMIHDSYGTTAGDAPLLADLTRRAFYSLYTRQDVVKHLADQFRPQLAEGDELPALPTVGTLDLGLVIESSYFFS